MSYLRYLCLFVYWCPTHIVLCYCFVCFVCLLCCQFLWIVHLLKLNRGRHYRDRLVVGFTTTYAISAYHHRCCEFESLSERGVQHYDIKIVSDLQQVDGFLRALRFPPPIKLTAIM